MTIFSLFFAYDSEDTEKCEKYTFDYFLDLSPILLLRGTGHSNACTALRAAQRVEQLAVSMVLYNLAMLCLLLTAVCGHR